MEDRHTGFVSTPVSTDFNAGCESDDDELDKAMQEYFDAMAGAVRTGATRCLCRGILAYSTSSTEIQAGILDMARIILDGDADEQDVEMAITTLCEALGPPAE